MPSHVRIGASVVKLSTVQPAGLFAVAVLWLLLSLKISFASHGLIAIVVSPAVLPFVVPPVSATPPLVVAPIASCALALSIVNLIKSNVLSRPACEVLAGKSSPMLSLVKKLILL